MLVLKITSVIYLGISCTRAKTEVKLYFIFVFNDGAIDI